MQVSLRSRLLAEGIGTFALVFVGAGAACTDVYSGGQLGLLGIALAHGLVLSSVITAIGHVSGGHVNPVVTLAALLGRAIEPAAAAMYAGAQLVGATIAGFVLVSMYAPDVWEPVALGTPVLGPGVAFGTGVFVEAVLTFLLVFVTMQVALDDRAPKHVYGFAIGLVMTFDMLAGGPVTGAAMNPARAFGPAIASGTWSNHLVYWIGPIMGAVVGSVAYGALRMGVQTDDLDTDDLGVGGAAAEADDAHDDPAIAD